MVVKSVISRKSWFNNFMILTFFISLVFLFSVLVSPVHAEVVVEDHFDSEGIVWNDGLDTDWTVSSMGGATDWTFYLYDGNMNVTDITSPRNVWGGYKLSQTLTSVGDFDVDFDFSWKSSGITDKQRVFIELYDTADTLISRVGYADYRLDKHGRGVAYIIGEPVFNGGYTTIPNGEASVDISRDDGNISVSWNDVPLLTGSHGVDLDRVEVRFDYFKNGSSTFGTESVDLVSVKGPVLPEPVSSILFITGGVTFGVRSYLRKKKQKV